jgi:Flp pilus assembly protein TadB
MSDRSQTEHQSIAEALRSVIRDVQDLLRAEVRLAKAEVQENVDRARKVGGLIGGAAAVGLFAGMSLVATCIAALAIAIPVWAAALIMTVVLAGAGAFLYSRGIARLRNFHPFPEQTAETLKKDIEWAKQRTR